MKLYVDEDDGWDCMWDVVWWCCVMMLCGDVVWWSYVMMLYVMVLYVIVCEMVCEGVSGVEGSGKVKWMILSC